MSFSEMGACKVFFWGEGRGREHVGLIDADAKPDEIFWMGHLRGKGRGGGGG